MLLLHCGNLGLCSVMVEGEAGVSPQCTASDPGCENVRYSKNSSFRFYTIYTEWLYVFKNSISTLS